MPLPKSPSIRLDGKRAPVARASLGLGLGATIALAGAGANAVYGASNRVVEEFSKSMALVTGTSLTAVGRLADG